MVCLGVCQKVVSIWFEKRPYTKAPFVFAHNPSQQAENDNIQTYVEWPLCHSLRLPDVFIREPSLLHKRASSVKFLCKIPNPGNVTRFTCIEVLHEDHVDANECLKIFMKYINCMMVSQSKIVLT